MNKKYIFVVVLIIIILFGFWFFKIYKQGSDINPLTDDISRTTQSIPPGSEKFLNKVSVSRNQGISSPLIMTGEARLWYFEGSFPVSVLDASGIVLGSGIAVAQGDWMTENFVPFVAEITFATSTTETGTLVLKKDNPSGLPEKDMEIRIPIKFNSVVKK